MDQNELHLKVFLDRSELVKIDGRIEVFLEGPASKDARARYKKIAEGLDGFLSNRINLCKESPAALGLVLCNLS